MFRLQFTQKKQMAIQDKVIVTKNYLKYIIIGPRIQNIACRRYKQLLETI